MKIAPVKIAVVGCGMVIDAYLATMKKRFKVLDVVGCCDMDPQKALEKALKYDIRALTMEEILADDSIELVVNLTTPGAHYPVIKRLLEGGKHVYTEKVLSVELEQAADLVNLANQKKLYLGAAPDTFLGSAIQTARYVVDSGMIGEVSSCLCTINRDSELFSRAYPFTARPGGGIGFDLGIYYITALLSILGPVSEVSGLAKTQKPQRQQISLEHFGEPYQIECETLMAGTLQFAGGTVGSLVFDSNSIFTEPERPNLVLFGSHGVVYMADPNHFGGEVQVILKGNNTPFAMQQSHAYREECRGLGVAEMAWSLRKGRTHRANEKLAYHALEVLHGIVRSGASKSNYILQSSFDRPPAIPRGYYGQTQFEFIEETEIAI